MKKGVFVGRTGKDYVENAYFDEKQLAEIERDLQDFTIPMTLRVDAEVIGLIDAIGHRFRDSRNSIAANCLRAFAYEAFESLSNDDRLKVAAKADEVINKYHEKNNRSSSGTFAIDWAKRLNSEEVKK